MKSYKSTYDDFVSNPEQKNFLDKEYKALLLSELLLAANAGDHLAVRRLAAAAGASSNLVAEPKSRKKTLSLNAFLEIIQELGCQIKLSSK